MHDDDFTLPPSVPSSLKLFSDQDLDKKTLEAEVFDAGAPAKKPAMEILCAFSMPITRRIVSFWGKPELLDYLNDITLMDRVGRLGFPVEVMNALMIVLEQTKSRTPESSSPWSDSPELQKTFKKEDQEKRSRMGSPISPAEAAMLDMADLKKSLLTDKQRKPLI